MAAQLIQAAKAEATTQGGTPDTLLALCSTANHHAENTADLCSRVCHGYTDASMLSTGVQFLYVHVAQDNTAAVQLYSIHCGFEQEQKESESYARALSRPSRLLLRKQIY